MSLLHEGRAGLAVRAEFEKSRNIILKFVDETREVDTQSETEMESEQC